MEFCTLHTRVWCHFDWLKAVFCSFLARSFLHPFYRVMCKSIAKRGSLLDIKWLGWFGCAVVLKPELEDINFVRGNHGDHYLYP